ncbi:MAG: methyltransferase [Alistipes sp.]
MFRFKHFTIAQDHCPMKVGTDAVLLGAWASVRPTDQRILDIGTGTGVLALMLAQRSAASITAVDIDAVCVQQARENADASAWGERVKTICCPIQQFSTPEAGFDLIISNPPYFDTTLPSPDKGRTLARHTIELTFNELITSACRLLATEGRFAVVLPEIEARYFKGLALRQLQIVRQTDVRTTLSGGVRRCLMEFVQGQPMGDFIHDELIIQTTVENYTPEYRALTQDFYLKF